MSTKDKTIKAVLENKVVILFVLLCIAAIYASKSPLTFVASELFTRFGVMVLPSFPC